MTYFKDQFIAESSESAASIAFNSENAHSFLSCAESEKNFDALNSDDAIDFIEHDTIDVFTNTSDFELDEPLCDDAKDHYTTNPLDILLELESHENSDDALYV